MGLLFQGEQGRSSGRRFDWRRTTPVRPEDPGDCVRAGKQDVDMPGAVNPTVKEEFWTSTRRVGRFPPHSAACSAFGMAITPGMLRKANGWTGGFLLSGET